MQITETYLNLKITYSIMKAGKKRKVKNSRKLNKKETFPQETKEKLVMIIFLVFVIVAIMVLFRTPSTTISGLSVLSTQLDETQFEIDEDLAGQVALQMQYISANIKDVLPEQTYPESS